MPLVRPPRAVCFDLWNTLACTAYSPHPLRTIASAFGLTQTPGWRRVLEEAMMLRPMSGIGEGLEALARGLGPLPPDGPGRRELTLMWGAACNANRLYPDTLPALDRLGRPDARAGRPALKLGLISNTQSFDLDFLRRDGLEARFHALVLSCHEGLLKPDPRIFQRAAGRLGLPPEEILMVGDSLHDDVRGAIAAGMQAALIVRGAAGIDPIADPVPLRAPSGVTVLSGLDELDALLGGESASPALRYSRRSR